MNRKLWTWLSIVLLLAALGGCSLAREDAAADGSQDRLAGALITTDYLDVFDMDAFMEEHAGELAQGGVIAVRDPDAYRSRLYADVQRDNDGIESVAFPGVNGLCFVQTKITSEESGEGYWSSFADDGISEIKNHISVSDEGEAITMEGTVFLTPEAGGEDMCFYVNPVYQTETGELYALSGQGFGFYSGWDAEGEIYSTTLRDEVTVTENGKRTSDTFEITVHLSIEFEPVEITVFQMDAAHRILREDSYAPGALPEKITAAPGAYYLLIETERLAPDGTVSIGRELFDDRDEDAAFPTFYRMESGYLARQETTVSWQDGTEPSSDPY